MTNGHLRIIPYFSPRSETTTYLVSTEGSRQGVIFDPVPLDTDFFTLILRNNLVISHVFVTHPESYMERAVKTLTRIFHFSLFCGEENVYSCHNKALTGESTIDLDDFQVAAIPALPHSRSSFFYSLDEVIFTGSIIHAGTIGETTSAYAEALLIASVKDNLFHHNRDTLILPSIGPPSTIGAESNLSPFYRDL